jgi:hypothetical protein
MWLLDRGGRMVDRPGAFFGCAEQLFQLLLQGQKALLQFVDLFC